MITECPRCGVKAIHADGTPSPHRCSDKPRGIGDIIESLIKLVTRGRVKTCGACRKRRDRLNRWWRFR